MSLAKWRAGPFGFLLLRWQAGRWPSLLRLSLPRCVQCTAVQKMSPQLAQAIRAARYASPPVSPQSPAITRLVHVPVLAPIIRPPAIDTRPQWTTPQLDLVAAWAPEQGPISLRQILEEVCRKHRLKLNEMRSKSRAAVLCDARFEYCYRAVIETSKSYVQIGEACGKDHTTIMNGVRVYCERNHLPLPRGLSPLRHRTNAA